MRAGLSGFLPATRPLACLALVAPVAVAQTVIQDGDFSSWTSEYKGPAGSDAQMQVLPTGGNPDSHIEATTVTGPMGWLVMWSTALSWDPAVDGPLESIDFQIDFKNISCWGDGMQIRPLLVQDGRFFLSTSHFYTYTGNCQWTTLDGFPQFAECEFMWVTDEQFMTGAFPLGSGPPNFGPTGAPIQLGFAVASSSSGTYVVLYDNWEMTLSPTADYEPGTPYCFGDGGGTPCPCSNDNDGSIEGGLAGCANGSFAGGARLSGQGTHSVPVDDLTLCVEGAVPLKPGLFFGGLNQTNGGQGAAFGDGLRCAGGGVVRLEIVTANGAGEACTGVQIAARMQVVPGDQRHFQYWFRDPQGSLCGTTFNLSNGYSVCWGP